MTTFTNSKLTDENVSNATLIRLILWAEQHNSHYVVAALRELQERRKADSVPVEVNDDMAYAFHHALSDSSLGADEVEEIKTGLRAAFANIAVQPALIVPHEWRLSNAQAFIERYSPPSVEEAALFAWNACRAAMLQGVEPASNHEELSEENGSSLQLRNLIRQRHAEWSDKTFGCVGPVGPLKHLSKEALEAAAEPDDLSEWADMQFLLWDAQRRAGISDAEITAAMEDKLKINMERQWPEPKDGEPRLHIKEPGNSPVTPDGWISCSERMPEKGQNVLISVNFDSSLVEPLICSARYTGSTFRRGDATIKQGNGIEQATHWMPLPEPPQEVK